MVVVADVVVSVVAEVVVAVVSLVVVEVVDVVEVVVGQVQNEQYGHSASENKASIVCGPLEFEGPRTRTIAAVTRSVE